MTAWKKRQETHLTKARLTMTILSKCGCDNSVLSRSERILGQKCLKCGEPFSRVVSHGTPTEQPLNKQVGGDHYKKFPIQPIEFIVKNNIPYREANAIKYVCRHRSKHGAEDIKKAIHYLEMILEEYES